VRVHLPLHFHISGTKLSFIKWGRWHFLGSNQESIGFCFSNSNNTYARCSWIG